MLHDGQSVIASLDHIARSFASAILVELSEMRDGCLVAGIDGPDCSGKTTLAQRILARIGDDASVSCLHFDDYSNSKVYREARGEFSVEAFYFDYFDVFALEDAINAISGGKTKPELLLVEGLFLYRPPLRDLFHYRVRLEIDEAMILERALRRDVGRLGNDYWVRRHYQEQCIPAQRRYIKEHSPASYAHRLLIAQEGGSFYVSR